MRIAVHADVELTVDSRDEAEEILLALADDPRVISMDYTTTERTIVPIREESRADFGMDAA
jgi:hypothetical protein